MHTKYVLNYERQFQIMYNNYNGMPKIFQGLFKKIKKKIDEQRRKIVVMLPLSRNVDKILNILPQA